MNNLAIPASLNLIEYRDGASVWHAYVNDRCVATVQRARIYSSERHTVHVTASGNELEFRSINDAIGCANRIAKRLAVRADADAVGVEPEAVERVSRLAKWCASHSDADAVEVRGRGVTLTARCLDTATREVFCEYVTVLNLRAAREWLGY